MFAIAILMRIMSAIFCHEIDVQHRSSFIDTSGTAAEVYYFKSFQLPSCSWNLFRIFFLFWYANHVGAKNSSNPSNWKMVQKCVLLFIRLIDARWENFKMENKHENYPEGNVP